MAQPERQEGRGPDDGQSAGLACLIGGGLLAGLPYWLHGEEARLKKDLALLRSMALTSVDGASAAAERLTRSSYVHLSGESFTDQPLKGQDGVLALALLRRKMVKKEEYQWQEGEKIYETREVTNSNGQRVEEKVDTGRRKQGQWVSHIRFSEAENKTLISPTGVCFRQLGATPGTFTSPAQICLDLGRFDVKTLLRCQPETRTFEPNEAIAVNVNVNVSHRDDRPARPASRVLGYEIRERLLPMGQEVYALGNVVWRPRASVKGMQVGGGSLAILQPARTKPSTFLYGCRDDFLDRQESQASNTGIGVRLTGMLSIGSILVGALALLAPRP